MSGRALLALALLTIALRRPIAAAGGEAVSMVRRWFTPDAGKAFEPLFESATERHSLPPGLLSRVAYQESRYKTDLVSSAGAQGIMQIIPRWHPGVDPFDPRQAIPYAARYLREQFDRFGTWALALAAYNAGPGTVAEYSGVPPFTETRNYVTEISRDVFGGVG